MKRGRLALPNERQVYALLLDDMEFDGPPNSEVCFGVPLMQLLKRSKSAKQR